MNTFKYLLFQNVNPDPRHHCGPYTKVSLPKHKQFPDTSCNMIGPLNHDTIGMIAIDKNGDVAAGTSTNGAKFKIPGYVNNLCHFITNSLKLSVYKFYIGTYYYQRYVATACDICMNF